MYQKSACVLLVVTVLLANIFQTRGFGHNRITEPIRLQAPVSQVTTDKTVPEEENEAMKEDEESKIRLPRQNIFGPHDPYRYGPYSSDGYPYYHHPYYPSMRDRTRGPYYPQWWMPPYGPLPSRSWSSVTHGGPPPFRFPPHFGFPPYPPLPPPPYLPPTRLPNYNGRPSESQSGSPRWPPPPKPTSNKWHREPQSSKPHKQNHKPPTGGNSNDNQDGYTNHRLGYGVDNHGDNHSDNHNQIRNGRAPYSYAYFIRH